TEKEPRNACPGALSLSRLVAPLGRLRRLPAGLARGQSRAGDQERDAARDQPRRTRSLERRARIAHAPRRRSCGIAAPGPGAPPPVALTEAVWGPAALPGPRRDRRCPRMLVAGVLLGSLHRRLRVAARRCVARQLGSRASRALQLCLVHACRARGVAYVLRRS